eukprot:275694-Pyramimonas_sp.AAC.1
MAPGPFRSLPRQGPCERAPECSQIHAVRVELHRLGPRHDGQRHVVNERVAGQALAEEEAEAEALARPTGAVNGIDLPPPLGELQRRPAHHARAASGGRPEPSVGNTCCC